MTGLQQKLADNYGANMKALRGRRPDLARKIEEAPPDPRLSLVSLSADEYAIAHGKTAVTDAMSPRKSTKKLLDGNLPDPWPHTLLLTGLGLGYHLAELLDREPAGLHGARHSFVVVEPSVDVFRLFLAAHNREREITDPCVHYFIGDHALSRLTDFFVVSVREPGFAISALPSGREELRAATVECVQRAQVRRKKELAELHRRLNEYYSGVTGEKLAGLLSDRPDRPFRVLLATSRFTSFLQYSTRDVQSALDELGHVTRVNIEEENDDTVTVLDDLRSIDEFRPDAYFVIDNVRRKLAQLPEGLPILAWIQDHMPTLFCREAGQSIGKFDFTFGFGRNELVERYSYPPQRVFDLTVMVNPRIYHPTELSDRELNEYGCEISYVSHASATPRTVLDNWLRESVVGGLHSTMIMLYDLIESRYSRDAFIYLKNDIDDMLTSCERKTGLRITDAGVRTNVLNIFFLRVNNAFYRQRVLGWLADAGVDLAIYGNGWEKHPALGRFARGVASNGEELNTIYQASRINLQIVPYLATHQRMLEGLSAGGFFLSKYNPVDFYTGWTRPLLAGSCRSFADLLGSVDKKTRRRLKDLKRGLKIELAGENVDLLKSLKRMAEYYERFGPQTTLPDYGRIVYDSKQELLDKVKRFLADEDERKQIAAEMRQTVIERFSYRSGMQHVLQMMRRVLSGESEVEHLERS